MSALKIIILRSIIIVASVSAITLPILTRSEVVFDGTTGPGGGLSGNMVIPASQGTTVGNNLFHSFSTFDINTGESALFTGPENTTNIINRVTGGNSSMLNGVLEHNMPNADFWLINPNGIMFGENARLPTTGAFHASTADYLQLEDGGRFGADTSLPENTVLTVAPPSEFGFLDSSVGAIAVQESNLRVQEGNTLSLVGGDLEITGGELVARSGTINVASVESPGEAMIGSQGTDIGSFQKRGDINLSQDGYLDVSDGIFGDPGAGSIYIQGGQFVMAGSRIDANTYEGGSGAINIDLSDGFEMSGGSEINSNSLDIGRSPDINLTLGGEMVLKDGSSIQSGSLYTGDAGTISVVAENLQLTAGSMVGSIALDSGNAGDLLISVSDTISIDGDYNTRLSSESFAFLEDGSAGDITLSAKDLVVNGGWISTESGPYSYGAAGNLNINVETLQLANGAYVTTSTRGGGAGGDLMLTAGKAIDLSTEAQIASTTNQFGNAGDIFIETPDLSLEERSLIQSSTFSDGKSGDVDIQVERLVLSNSNVTADALFTDFGLSTGNTGNVSIVATESIRLINELGDQIFKPRISSTTFGSGDAGTVSIKTPSLSISNGSIDTNTLFSSGNAGNILIDVETLSLEDGGFIMTDVGEEASGKGGDISVAASTSLSITGEASGVNDVSIHSSISTVTLGQGNAGTIEISSPNVEIDLGNIAATTAGDGAAGAISLDDVDRLVMTGGGNIQAGTLGTGAGGNITIDSDMVSIAGGSPDNSTSSGVFATTKGSGDAGSISLTTSQTYINDGAKIRSNATRSGDAGSVLVTAKDELKLKNGSIETKSDRSAGGNVTIEAGNLVYLDGSAITAEAQGVSPGNDGGNISIDPTFIILKDGEIVARANAGNGGNITLVADALIVDPNSVIDASSATGINGEVVIETPNRDISTDIVALNASILDVSQLLRKRCAAAALKDRSSFTDATEGGLSNSPDVYIGGVYWPRLDSKGGAGAASDPVSHLHSVPLSLATSSLVRGRDGCYYY